MARTLFVNALLVDGRGSPARPGTLLADNGVIAGLDVSHEDAGSAARIVDLDGAALCPGFIDTHSHSDLVLLLDPHVPAKLRQGVTTEILGQDGIAMAPLPEAYVGPWRKNLAGLDGDSDEIGWDWETMDGYLSLLAEQGIGPNAGCLVPHGNARMEAMGLDARAASEAQVKAMTGILEREFDAGALGFSTGLIYIPCAYADRRELSALCAVAARRKKPLVIHQRSEADDILASMEEVLSLGRETGVHVHFSHFKLCGKNNAAKFAPLLALLDAAHAEGIAVSFDQYPYTAGSTMLSVILPPWAHDGGTDRLLARLADPGERARMRRDIASGLPGWDNFVDFAGTDGIFVTSVRTAGNAWTVGKNLDQIGEALGADPLDAAMDILLAEQNAVGMVDFYGIEEHVEALMQRPEMNVCTDGLLHGTPHPRAFGAFARVLGHYVRERRVLSLEEAVRKMTGKAAEVFGLSDRGVLEPGRKADLVAFDPEAVADTATYTAPRSHPSGIRLVCVNGEIEVAHGRQNQTLSGQVLRG